MFSTASTARVSSTRHQVDTCSRHQGRLRGGGGMSAVGLSSGMALKGLGASAAQLVVRWLAVRPHLRFGLGLPVRRGQLTFSFAGASGFMHFSTASISKRTAHRAVARFGAVTRVSPHYAECRMRRPCRFLPRRRPIAKRPRIRKLICFCRRCYPVGLHWQSQPFAYKLFAGCEHPAYKCRPVETTLAKPVAHTPSRFSFSPVLGCLAPCLAVFWPTRAD